MVSCRAAGPSAGKETLYRGASNDTGMGDTFWYGTALAALLLAMVFFAGCSEEPAGTAVPVPATVPVVKYAAGDIIARSGLATGSEYYLILGYNRSADQYERAWVSRNPDGSFGYRADNRTDRSSRASVEKVYPVKIARVAVSSIPVVTPTEVAAATAMPGSAPVLIRISPDTASEDSTVSVTITGRNFQDGATVKLVKPGYPPNRATALFVKSSAGIDCTFNLGGLDTGTLNLVVTNPDGQSDTMTSAFTISPTAPVVVSVYPGTIRAGETSRLVIYGQNFQERFKVTLGQGQALLDCMNPEYEDATKVFCDLAVPAATRTGSWNLTIITMANGQKGRYPRPFTITNAT